MPTIAIDYTPAYEQGGGIGRLVRDLVAALAQQGHDTDYRLFISGAQLNDLPEPPYSNFTWKPTRISPTWLARLWHRANLPIPVEIFTGSVDLYHATDFVLPPTRKHTRTVVTVHDLSFVRVPETASPNLKAYLDRVVPQSVQRADHVIADSQATKDDLIDLYNLSPDKISVLLSGIQSHFHPVDDPQKIQAVRNKYNLGNRPYIFSIGTVQPRKNYGRVIEALATLREQGYDISFVVAGGKGWLEETIYDTLKSTQMEPYVHFIGFADDADLPALYSGAACVAFPSLYEGFGFPVLESMACGTPVVTSNISSLPEVAGDAALMVNPLETGDITAALKKLLDDSTLRGNLRQRGFKQSRQFTWDSAAKQLQNIYNQVLSG